MSKRLRISRRTRPEGLGRVHRPAVAGSDAAAHGVRRGGRRRPPRCGWRSSTSPTACTWPTGRRRRRGPASSCRRSSSRSKRVQGRPPGPDRPDADKARPHGDGGGDHARAMASVPHRPPAAQDRRRRHPRRRLRRSGGRPGGRPGDALPLAGDRLRGRQERRQLRLRLQLRLLVEPLLARRIDADGQGDQPQLVFDRLFGTAAQGRRRAPPAATATSRASSTSSARTPSRCKRRSAPTTGASWTST